MPNPWDVGSARLLASFGFEALATTSAGFAWSLGKLDQAVTRDELVAHVASLAAATPCRSTSTASAATRTTPAASPRPWRCSPRPARPGFSIEDYDPATGRIDDVEVAAERVAIAAQAAHGLAEPLVLTGRAENHIRGVDDLDDTIARLLAYRDAGADAVYAPGLHDLEQIAAVVEAVGVPVNVLALRDGPTVAELASVGVRRVSTGGSLAGAAYGALLAGARELLADGTSTLHLARRHGRGTQGRVRDASLALFRTAWLVRAARAAPRNRRARGRRGAAAVSASASTTSSLTSGPSAARTSRRARRGCHDEVTSTTSVAPELRPRPRRRRGRCRRSCVASPSASSGTSGPRQAACISAASDGRAAAAPSPRGRRRPRRRRPAPPLRAARRRSDGGRCRAACE